MENRWRHLAAYEPMAPLSVSVEPRTVDSEGLPQWVGPRVVHGWHTITVVCEHITVERTNCRCRDGGVRELHVRDTTTLDANGFYGAIRRGGSQRDGALAQGQRGAGSCAVLFDRTQFCGEPGEVRPNSLLNGVRHDQGAAGHAGGGIERDETVARASAADLEADDARMRTAHRYQRSSRSPWP